MAKILQQLIDERFGTPTGPTGRAPTVVVTTAETVVLPNDQNRLAAVVVNLGSNAVYIGMTGVVTSTNGIRLEANGGFMILNWDKDYFLVGREWRAISVTGSQTVLRVEVESF